MKIVNLAKLEIWLQQAKCTKYGQFFPPSKHMHVRFGGEMMGGRDLEFPLETFKFYDGCFSPHSSKWLLTLAPLATDLYVYVSKIKDETCIFLIFI